MSMNSSGQIRLKNLSQEILRELNAISADFSAFQKKANLPCGEGCGHCCFKPDIFCTPIELLPLALELMEKGKAEEVYDQCKKDEIQNGRCFFMKVTDEEKGMGHCIEYKFRPLVCRTFGVGARKDKNGGIDFSVCATLKNNHPENYQKLLSKAFIAPNEVIPFIDQSKNRLASLDPNFLGEEFPINQSLCIILEKVLLIFSYE